jgi:hypothetical protein
MSFMTDIVVTATMRVSRLPALPQKALRPHSRCADAELRYPPGQGDTIAWLGMSRITIHREAMSAAPC